MEKSVRVAVLIKKDSRYLLVREAHERARGLWNWSQGRVEESESLEEAALREAKEETGYDVAVIHKLTVVHDPFPDTKEIHVFLGKVIGGELSVPEDEILETRWLTLEEIVSLETPGPWVYETIAAIQE